MNTPRETFHYGPVRFDITEAKRITEGRESVEYETARLAPVLGSFGCNPDLADALPDEALDSPLIFVTLETGRPMIVDGLHRIHAASARGRERLHVVTLTREETLTIQSGPVVV